MPVKARIDPVEKVTTAQVLADLQLPEQKKAAADFVRAGIADADQTNHQTNRRVLGRVPPRTITVDGRLNAPLESVNPNGGNVVVEYELVSDLLRWIADTLIQRSPVVSGDYKRSHTLFADGREVPLNGEIPQAEEYTFINPIPYARKIEIGKTKSGRAFVIQVPNRIYERTATDARSRFGNQAAISFGYRATTGAYTLKRSNASGNRRGGRNDRAAGAAVQSPAIIVKARRS
jgi:hypothetical protein